MKFLADQDVYATTVQLLKGLGHDVVPAAQIGMAQAADLELLRVAREEERILITRDRDFGRLVFLHGGGQGVIYLRVVPQSLQEVHAEFRRILTMYSERDLFQSFVVVEPARHRIRKLEP